MSFFECGELSFQDIRSLPHFRRKTSKGEYSSSCPKCGGEDRFISWEDGGYWCRQCNFKGFVIDAPIEERKRSLRDIVSSIPTNQTLEFHKWEEYHSTLYDSIDGQVYWGEALGPNYILAVERYKLGWCRDYLGLGPTAVIPISSGGKIILAKHRFINQEKPKYTTEPSGFGATLFGLDWILHEPKVVLTEGEKKAMRVWLAGYPAVSPTNGVNGFRGCPHFAKLFFDDKDVFIVFDPDSAGQKEAKYIQTLLPRSTNIILPGKVDDVINEGLNLEEYMKGW